MKLKDTIIEIYKEIDRDFYLFDLDEFRGNIKEFTDAFTRRYDKFRLAYSYKTNYSPALCSTAQREGALAEVVSSFEYDLALRNRVSPSNIIVNGPVHDSAFLSRALQDGVQLNVDGFYMLARVREICDRNAGSDFRVGLRFNFQINDGSLSRFGFYDDEETITRLKRELSEVSNLAINALHCHFSTALRSTESFASRTSGLVGIYKRHFFDQPVQQLNIGGGFFSKMPKSLQRQFGVEIPGYDEYAEAIVSAIADDLGDTWAPTLIIEPGTAVATNTGCFACPVLDIKTIGDKNFALLSGSVHNIKPTMNAKNLPFSVFNLSNTIVPEKKYDFVGYTCMETDYLCRDVDAALSEGDLIVFSNVGGYTNVFKPPFIRLQSPIYGVEEGEVRLLKRAEVTEDVTRTYLYP